MISPTAAALLVLLLGWRLQPRRIRTPATRSTLIVAAQRGPIYRFVDALAAPRRARRWRANHFADLLDLFVATVRAGLTPAQATSELIDIAPPAFADGLSAVSLRIERGQLFAEAIVELRQRWGALAIPLIDSLAMADRYGLPLAPVLDRLADEARAHRRRQAEAEARKLPIRLSFPLVCCTLPSFVVLSVVPLLAGTLSTLRTLTP